MRNRVFAAILTLVASITGARAGGIPLLTGPLDPGNTLYTLNNLITQINSQILASGTGSLASALSIPTVAGAVAGADNALVITPSAPGGGTVTLQAAGVDPNVSLVLQSQGAGDIQFNFPGTGLLSIPAGSMSIVPTGHMPMTLGNALYGYGPLGVSGPPIGFLKIKFAGAGGSPLPGYIPVWSQYPNQGLLQ